MSKTSDNSNEPKAAAKKDSGIELGFKIESEIFWNIQECEGTIEVDGVSHPYWFGPNYENGGLAFYIYEDETHGGDDTMFKFVADIDVYEEKS